MIYRAAITSAGKAELCRVSPTDSVLCLQADVQSADTL